MTSIHAVVASGDVDQLVATLVDGGDPNEPDSAGRTPLAIAAAAGDRAVVEALLAHDADPRRAPAGTDPPLYLAAERGHLDVVHCLLEIPGLDVNARTARGWSPLIAAAFAGEEATVRALLADDAVRTNALDGQGRSALWWAATGGHGQIAEALARAGSDLRAMDDNGTDPAAAADAARHPELAARLRDLRDERPAVGPADPADRFVPEPLPETGRVIREQADKLHGGR